MLNSLTANLKKFTNEPSSNGPNSQLFNSLSPAKSHSQISQLFGTPTNLGAMTPPII